MSTQEATEVDVSTQFDEKGYVYVHVNVVAPDDGLAIRIWKTTFLIDKHSAHESKMVHAENICFAPQWQLVPPNSSAVFVLIFEGLPKACKNFDLVERIPQPDGFVVSGIARNTTDVYKVSLD